MKTNAVVAVFDRKKQLPKAMYGAVELRIYLSRGQMTYIRLKKCTKLEWRAFQKSSELESEINMYEEIVDSMRLLHEEMSVECFRKHIGISEVDTKKTEIKKKMSDPKGFINYIREIIETEDIRPVTLQRKRITADSLEIFGKMSRFQDITLENLREYDKWLRKADIRTEKEKLERGSRPRHRTDVCVNNYHRIVRMYTHQALLDGLIDKDPYEQFVYPRGKYKERHPLTEEELVLIRSLHLPLKEDRVRDLFVFCAYTGLAYVDSQAFDFKTMAEKHGDVYYIDGRRTKSGTNFYTPILPPAMEVLKKYNYQLPRISNQKANDYLHLVQSRAGITKPMTTHVARHSFATLVLSHDVPVEKLARMMGHKNILTTQVYAKILKSTIQKHADALINDLL